jgi:uncharacterized protein YndB with AHSA1/START domain
MTRAIRLEVDVPGTPEDVWQTVATGPGISSWFVPATVEECAGGAVGMHFGEGMDETATVTAWEPPHRFAYATGEGTERALEYEWLIEPGERDGASRVALVNSGFGEGAEWDRDYEGMAGGWPLFLENLRLVRAHFPGQACASVPVSAVVPGTPEEAYAALLAALGAQQPATGDEVELAALGIAGRAERVGPSTATLLLALPAPGVAFLAAEGSGSPAYVSVYGYFFGPEAGAVAQQAEARWRAWLAERFPPDGEGAEPGKWGQ